MWCISDKMFPLELEPGLVAKMDIVLCDAVHGLIPLHVFLFFRFVAGCSLVHISGVVVGG